ncbi:MAG: Hint domain-containing protein [Pseudomonadota bacterium]
MAFTDVIDDYSNGSSGTLTTSDGGTVGYTVSGNVQTVSKPGTDKAAKVNGDGSQSVTVAFDDTVHGVTLAFSRSNAGEEYFIEIDGVVVDLNEAIADGRVEFTQNSPETHIITEDGGVSSSSSDFENGSIGYIHFQSPVNSVRVFGSGADSGNFDLVEIGVDSTDFRVVCFAADTLVETIRGPVRIADLKPGDTLLTFDRRSVTVMRRDQRTVSPIDRLSNPKLFPVRICAGALGHGLPYRDMWVSRQHRILIASDIAHALTGHDQILIPAIHLCGYPGIDVDPTLAPLSYHHILCSRHEVLIAEGAPAESLFVGTEAKLTLAGNSIRRAARGPAQISGMVPARPFVKGKLAKSVIAAHAERNLPLLKRMETVAARCA